MDIDRREEKSNVPIGIMGIDHILSGGVPAGGLYVVSGGTGTGKTIMGLQFCIQGIEQGENCLFVTLEEKREGIEFNAPPLLRKRIYENQDKMYFLDLASLRSISAGKDDMESKIMDMQVLCEVLERWKKERDIKRCVIDGIASVGAIYGKKDRIREDLFILGGCLRKLGLTTIITIEAPDENTISRYGIEEYISDGVLYIRRHGERRYVDVIKMRGKGFSPGPHEMQIRRDGIHVYPKIVIKRDKKASNKMESIGVPGLDDLLGGGIYQGDVTVLNGSPGSGKTVMGLKFIKEALDKGEQAVFVTFKESRAEVIRNARLWGLDIQDDVKKKKLTIMDESVMSILPCKHLYHLRDSTRNASRIVIESIEDYNKTLFDPLDPGFRQYIEYLIGTLKENGTTALLLSDSPDIMGASITEMDQAINISDNVVLLRYVEDSSKLKGAVMVLKKKSGSSSRDIREFSIQNKTITIGNIFENLTGIMSPKATRVEKVERFFT